MGMSSSLAAGYNYVQSIAKASGSAALYAADATGIFYRLMPGTLADWERLPSELGGTRVLFIFCDLENRLLAGLFDGGVYVSSPNSAAVSEREWDALGNLPTGLAARAMDYGPDGLLWLATSAGIYRWNGTLWDGPFEGTSGRYVTALKRNPQVPAEVFVGTDDGQVGHYLTGSWTWEPFGILNSDRVWDIGYGAAGRVFAATDGGLYWLDVAATPHVGLPLILRDWGEAPTATITATPTATRSPSTTSTATHSQTPTLTVTATSIITSTVTPTVTATASLTSTVPTTSRLSPQ